jgi:tetratricopeptide (TPR) repeat protein
MSMGGSQFLRRINIHHINIILYVIIIWLVVQYQDPLRWAMREIPRYSQDKIVSPIERKLYKQAESIIRTSKQIDPARELLERSLAIDPNTEARFLLGEYYDKKGKKAKALQHYKGYLEIDPTVLETYLRMAHILKKQNKPEEARQILEQGFDYFNKYSRQFKARENMHVDRRYNEDATNTYIYYLQAYNYLKVRLDAYAHP